MTDNPLLQKYEELYKPKEPEKPKYHPLDSPELHSIHFLETLIKEIKEGRSVIINSDTKRNVNYMPPISFDYSKPPSHCLEDSNLLVQEGLQTTLTIFRRYE